MPEQREPELDDAQARHCARMREYLAMQIAAAHGWLGFERFMDAALYAPGLGYYSAGARKLGAGGDFTTAPEISPLFGACVARQCAEVLRALETGRLGGAETWPAGARDNQGGANAWSGSIVDTVPWLFTTHSDSRHTLPTSANSSPDRRSRS